MYYFKLVKDNIIFGVITQDDFYKYQFKHDIFLPCSLEQGEYVFYNNILYRSDWMISPKENISYEKIDIIKITQQEYELLFNSLQVENELVDSSLIEADIIDEKEQYGLETETELTTDYIRSVKLKEMSSICNKTITNGFDITLSDGDTYHFSLTTQDQLNLITLATMVESGETQIPYHADGAPCKFYSATDIKSIIDKATEFKTYHISYYNSLKIYINSMETMEEISEVTYGIEIPEEYQSEVLKAII